MTREAEMTNTEVARAAMCIWEWMLDARGTTPEVDSLFGNSGACEMRDKALQMGHFVNAAWELCGNDFDEPFDWEFVPKAMSFVEWNRGILTDVWWPHGWTSFTLAHEVMAMRKAEDALRAEDVQELFDNSVAELEGWSIFLGGGVYRIERCDEAEVFKSDYEAWRHVATLARKGSWYHLEALRFLQKRSPEEYSRVQGFLGPKGTGL